MVRLEPVFTDGKIIVTAIKETATPTATPTSTLFTLCPPVWNMEKMSYSV
jgi:hypothetical protein